MTNPIIKIHDVETGEVVEREMNAEELAVYKAAIAIPKPTKEELEAKAAKDAATAKLEALGLTLDDLKALGL